MFSSTTSISTGQIVRLAVLATGSFISPVMFATASTPESASTIRTKLSHRFPQPCTPVPAWSAPRWMVESPLAMNGTHIAPITALAMIAAIAMMSANRPALLAPNQLITPIPKIVTTQHATTIFPGTPK